MYFQIEIDTKPADTQTLAMIIPTIPPVDKPLSAEFFSALLPFVKELVGWIIAVIGLSIVIEFVGWIIDVIGLSIVTEFVGWIIDVIGLSIVIEFVG